MMKNEPPTRISGSTTRQRPAEYSRILLAAALLAVAGCGGGGGGGNSNGSSGGGGGNGGGGSATNWVPGVFEPTSDFAARCAMPRTGGGFQDRQGTTLNENNWLRSWSNDLYLWFDEILDQDPALFEALEYFEVLKTQETTPSGRPKDRFHFAMDTEAWRALAQSGVSPGYGVTWAVIAGSPPREIVVAFTEPNSPATELNVGLTRGARVLEIDGVDAVNGADVDTLNAGLFPAGVGESHTFTIQDPGSTEDRTITMTAIDVTSTPVQNVGAITTQDGKVGYILFNDHIATSEQALIDAINELNDENVDDLVLDIRYNGGGFLAIANELAYMVAGEERTAGKGFERLRFNDKHPEVNPVTGEPLTPMPFITTTTGSFNAPSGQPLPTLGLPRVFVLTGPGTCSASESIMNALLGIDVDVIQVGSTTCGKPFGFYPADNCGTTYFTIQFQGVNDKGFGDYPDGFSPQGNAVDPPGVVIPGCSVADDFSRELGDPAEARLAVALAFRADERCPASSGVAVKSASPSSGIPRSAEIDAVVHRPHRLPGKIIMR